MFSRNKICEYGKSFVERCIVERKGTKNVTKMFKCLKWNKKCAIIVSVKRRTEKMYGYVYVVEFDGHYKIGSSINPQRRAQEVTRFYKEPNLVISERVPNFREIELVVHKMFETKRERGEWFRLDADDLVVIKDYLGSVKDDEDIPEPTCEYMDVDVKHLKNYGMAGFLMNNSKDVIDKLSNSHTAFYALIILCKYLLADYNLLVKDGRKFKIMDLADEMGIVRQRASDYMKRLKNENLVCEIETSTGKYWAVNPYYFCNGSGCDERVIKAFEKQAEELAEKNKKQNS